MKKIKTKLTGLKFKSATLLVLAVFSIIFLSRPAPAEAHCDSVTGPVVNAARAALEKGDVDLVLPYVKPDSEQELTAAFDQTLKVRKLSGSAQELADTYFFETAVRLHRAGEGAAYTGLKYEADFGPALEAADKALESGSIKEVNKLLQHALDEGVTAKFDAVKKARANADRAGTVEAQRERAEAELQFEQYVYGLYNLAVGETVHAEGQAQVGH